MVGDKRSCFLSCRCLKGTERAPVWVGVRQGHEPELRLKSALCGGSCAWFALLLSPFLCPVQQAIEVSIKVGELRVVAPAPWGKAFLCLLGRVYVDQLALGSLKAGCRRKKLEKERILLQLQGEHLFGMWVEMSGMAGNAVTNPESEHFSQVMPFLTHLKAVSAF